MNEDGQQEGSPVPPDQINAFTPYVPLKQKVNDTNREGVEGERK